MGGICLKQDFLKLISILIGQEPGHLVSDNQEKLHNLSKRFNETLQITRVEERFHTEMMYEGKNCLIPPVPFASTNKQDEPLAFAFLGLNPKLFLHNETTINEKRNAGNTWEQYATSYTTNQRNEPNIGNFYRKLTILMESLKNKRLVTWSEFNQGCKNAEEKLVRYLTAVERDPIFVGEFIPLHSSKIKAYDKRTVQMLSQKVKEYEPYLTELFTIISNKLCPNGWLITNGKASSAALEIFIENHFLNGHFSKILDKRDEGYTCYEWEHNGVYRKVLLLHQFLGIRGGKLNSYYDIEIMLHNVLKAFDLSHTSQVRDMWETDGIWNEELEIEIEEEEASIEIEEEGFMQAIENGYESFGQYAELAGKIDQFIVNEMTHSAYRMKNITGGVGYHESPDGKMNSFAKLFNHKHPFLLLRFGKKSEGDHKGIVKQIEFDRKLGLQPRRNLANLYNYPNEAFVYLENLAKHNNEITWKFVKKNINEAFGVYYKKE